MKKPVNEVNYFLSAIGFVLCAPIGLLVNESLYPVTKRQSSSVNQKNLHRYKFSDTIFFHCLSGTASYQCRHR